jgi:Cof subfamily protein (haloacid dehalogenase superfamily)
MWKAIAIDLDGTLLNSDKSIAPLSLEMLREAESRGWVIAISTARPVRAIKLAVPEEFASYYWAACNGAWILRNGQIIQRTEIPHATASQLMKSLQDHGLCFQVEAEDKLFSDCELPAGFVSEYYGLDHLDDIDVCKVIVNTHSADEIKMAQELIPSGCAGVVTDGGSLVQIAHSRCTKLAAMDYILNREGIALKHAIAFGDDNNDTTLLEAAGCGVAMGNGTDEVKQVADHTTATNDEDGVGLFLASILNTEAAPAHGASITA